MSRLWGEEMRRELTSSTGELVYENTAYNTADDANDGGNGYRRSGLCE